MTLFVVIRDSIVASIPACHAGDRSSILRRGDIFIVRYLLIGEVISNAKLYLPAMITIYVFIITDLTCIIHPLFLLSLGTIRTNDIAKGKKEYTKTADTQGKKVPPRFELGLPESEPDVITTYTMGPMHEIVVVNSI